MPEGLFVKHFSILKDPRVERTKRHLLIDIIAIVLCATIAGIRGWEQLEAYALAKEEWLKTFLSLPNGIPSHDTLARVFSRICPKSFQTAFLSWVNEIVDCLAGEVIAVDGKALCCSGHKRKNQKPLHLISAFATEQQMSLCQMAVEDKTNEITKIPELLEMLVLKGAIVTMDAMGCQREIAQRIVEKQGEYVLAVKGNQGSLHKAIENAFFQAEANDFNAMVYSKSETVDGEHGRIETRKYTALPFMYFYEFKEKWAGIQSVLRVESIRESKGGSPKGRKGKTKREIRYYISSLGANAEHLGRCVRYHWRIENNLHWSLDVTFREDTSCIRKDHAPQNMALIRRFALSLLRQDTSKGNVPKKQLKALLDDNYLLSVLKQARTGKI